MGESRFILSGYFCKALLREDEEWKERSLGADCRKNHMRKKTELESPPKLGTL